jgi:hypothetical protein
MACARSRCEKVHPLFFKRLVATGPNAPTGRLHETDLKTIYPNKPRRFDCADPGFIAQRSKQTHQVPPKNQGGNAMSPLNDQMPFQPWTSKYKPINAYWMARFAKVA